MIYSSWTLTSWTNPVYRLRPWFQWRTKKKKENRNSLLPFILIKQSHETHFKWFLPVVLVNGFWTGRRLVALFDPLGRSHAWFTKGSIWTVDVATCPIWHYFTRNGQENSRKYRYRRTANFRIFNGMKRNRVPTFEHHRTLEMNHENNSTHLNERPHEHKTVNSTPRQSSTLRNHVEQRNKKLHDTICTNIIYITQRDRLSKPFRRHN